MTYVVNWRGLHGYGDFIPPSTYAHNESVRLDEDVHVIFHVVNEKRKYKSRDKSTYAEIIDFIFRNTDKKDVTRTISWEMRYDVFYDYIPEPMHSNGLDAMYAIHNHRLCNEEWRWNGCKQKQIAVVSTQNHAEKFRNVKYRNSEVGSKSWKDAWPDDWEEFTLRFEQYGFNVVPIHYEMSVDEIATILRESAIVYGYHGGATWLAKWMNCPMVVCSGDKHFSETIFPWSIWYGPKQFDEVFYNLYEDLEKSIEKRDKYNFNSELYRHAIPGIYSWQAASRYFHKRAFPFFSHDNAKVWNAFNDLEQKEIEQFLNERKISK